MTIRRARDSDAPVLAELSAQLGYPMAAELAEARVTELIRRDDHAIFVAEAASGGVIGWVHVFRALTIESGAQAEIGGLVVRDGHRNQGTGKALVAAAVTWGDSNGLEQMRVRSNTIRDDAHRFYEHLGFTRAKTQAVFSKPLGGAGARS